MAKRPSLVFLDTNVFLGAYEDRELEGLELLGHLAGKKARLITTDQVWHEFLRNRSRILGKALKDLRDPDGLTLPGRLLGKRVHDRFVKTYDTYLERVDMVRDRIQEMIVDPAKHDPVYRTVAALFEPPGPLHLGREGEEYWRVYEAARRRNEVGDPPRKPGSIALGDGINWEWCIEVAAREGADVQVVTMDSDFGVVHDRAMLGNTFLVREFHRRVPGREVSFTPSLGTALRTLGIAVPRD